MSRSTDYLTLADTFLSIFLFAPLVVACWRGTWQLLELYLFPEDPYLSNWICLAVGTTIIVVFALVQRPLALAVSSERSSKCVFLVVSRLYTLVYAFANVNHWRGVWEVLSLYTGREWPSAALSVVVGTAVLIFLRVLRNIVAPPCLVILDEETDYFSFPTMFKAHESHQHELPQKQHHPHPPSPSPHHHHHHQQQQQQQHHPHHNHQAKNSLTTALLAHDVLVFVCDVLFSVLVVCSLVVFVWRGVWILLDIYFFPDDHALSAWGSFSLGVAITLASFFFQEPSSKLARQMEPRARIAFEDLVVFVVNFGTINVWRGVWKLLDVYLFPQKPLLSNVLSQTVGFVLLVAFYNGNSILSRGVLRDGEQGSDRYFEVEYLQKFYELRKKRKEKAAIHPNKKWNAKDIEMNSIQSKSGAERDDDATAVAVAPLMEEAEVQMDGTLVTTKQTIANGNNHESTV